MSIKSIITDWVRDNFGDSEVEDPSWNIDLLAEYVKEKIKEECYKCLDKIQEICYNIDGCCVSICQGEDPDIIGEVEDIDKYSSQIQEEIYKITGGY